MEGLNWVMNDHKHSPARRTPRDRSRMPRDSLFYERMVPLILIGLGLVTLLLILVALGVLLGLVPFR